MSVIPQMLDAMQPEALLTICITLGACRLLVIAAGGSGSKGGYDGKRLIMKVDCSSTRLDAQSADALARQLPFVADVENCTALPVECWLQCEAKPSASGDAQAADTAGAETDLQSLQIKRVTDTIASLVADSPVSGVSGEQVGRLAAPLMRCSDASSSPLFRGEHRNLQSKERCYVVSLVQGGGSAYSAAAAGCVVANLQSFLFWLCLALCRS